MLVLCSAIPTFGGAIDLLVMPSEKVEWAPYSILMDVERVDTRLVMVGERGRIVFADGECTDWTQGEVPVSVTLTAVYFPTPDQGWAVGHDGVVLHTEDGGSTWEKQLDGTQINEMVLAQIKQLIAQNNSFAENEAGLTEEKQKDMEAEAERLRYFQYDAEFSLQEGASRPLLDVWFKNDREGIVVGSYGLILSTTDGGKTWQPILDRVEKPEARHFYGIIRCGDDLFIAGESGTLLRSADFGKSWQRLKSPYDGTFFSIIGDPSGGFVAAFGLKGTFFYSLDRGETWLPSKTGLAAAISCGAFLSDGSFVIVSVDGVILRSKDRGKTFTALPAKAPGSVAITDVRRDVLMAVGIMGFSRIEINNQSSEK